MKEIRDDREKNRIELWKGWRKEYEQYTEEEKIDYLLWMRKDKECNRESAVKWKWHEYRSNLYGDEDWDGDWERYVGRDRVEIQKEIWKNIDPDPDLDPDLHLT